ncbi:MAG: TIGR01212 family radical SAM protein [Deltaproteobacteria bacterium]|nr:TIGR01212 family radical SAM protein [Deltaproteobacteria bacterium]
MKNSLSGHYEQSEAIPTLRLLRDSAIAMTTFLSFTITNTDFLTFKSMTKRYSPISDFLKNKFGCKVFKVSLNAGLTCPNRDGTKGIGGCIYCKPETLMPLNYHYENNPPLSPFNKGGMMGGFLDDMKIREQLYDGIAYIRKRHKAEKFISYFQINTNTYAPVSALEKIYQEGIDHPDVVGIAVSTRPDCVDDNILDLLQNLSKEKFLWLELGLQSSHNKMLKLINRCHTVENFTDAVKRATERKIPVCSHVILGLPGETREDMLATARFLSNLGIWGIKLHHIHIHKGTKLEEMYKKGKFRPLGLDEYADLVVKFLQEIPEDIIIHRLCGRR